MSMRPVGYWFIDSIYYIRATTQMYLAGRTSHFKPASEQGKPSVILLSGITFQWGVLKHLIKNITDEGFHVYVLPDMGYNFWNIEKSAARVREFIDENKLSSVAILGYSKGGIIGKYLLKNHNNDGAIKKVVSVASPFSGSKLVRVIPHKSFGELEKKSEIIQSLLDDVSVNSLITSIYPKFDNLILPQGGSFLKGAKNIEINSRGHHKILFHKDTKKTIMDELSSLVESL